MSNQPAQHQLIVARDLEGAIGESQSASKGRWYGAFDVLLWLNTLTMFPSELRLELHYEDDKGAHELLVDRCSFSKNPLLLLSNRLSVGFVGKVSQAHLVICSDEPFKINVLESKLSPASVSADQYLKKAA